MKRADMTDDTPRPVLKARPLAPAVRTALQASVPILTAGALVLLLLPSYWVFLMTAVFIIGIALQSIGLVTGRAGMISLCQMSFAAVGAWVTGWLNVADAPGGLLVWVLIGGLTAVPIGIAVGLPALRLRGINLAIVTLGFAAAFDTILATITFPGQTRFIQVQRPDLFASDQGYFVLVLLVYTVIAVVLALLNQSRLGASWGQLRHSERAAAAHGVGIPAAKLTAFAISAFVAGVSGGLLAGYLGTLLSDNFNMMQSLVLFAVAMMVGAHFGTGALIGGVLVALFPELLRRLGLPQDLGTVIFAVGAVQALSTGESISETLARVFGRRRRAAPVGAQGETKLPAKAEHGAGEALRIKDLTVRYGAVVALQAVNLSLPAGRVVGLIGPNGAGKSTMVDAIAGFLPAYDGAVALARQPLEGVSATARARAGIRRTWQTTRIAPELTVEAYIRLAARDLNAAEVAAVLDWWGCPPPGTLIASVDAGTRRLLDVAAVVAARPPVVLLDEPAAGQSYDEALKLAERIRAIPDTFGSAVLLIEHDMDLVRHACSEVTVIDFGKVIATGAPQDVLSMPVVQKAYLGEDIEGDAA